MAGFQRPRGGRETLWGHTWWWGWWGQSQRTTELGGLLRPAPCGETEARRGEGAELVLEGPECRVCIPTRPCALLAGRSAEGKIRCLHLMGSMGGCLEEGLWHKRSGVLERGFLVGGTACARREAQMSCLRRGARGSQSRAPALHEAAPSPSVPFTVGLGLQAGLGGCQTGVRGLAPWNGRGHGVHPAVRLTWALPPTPSCSLHPCPTDPRADPRPPQVPRGRGWRRGLHGGGEHQRLPGHLLPALRGAAAAHRAHGALRAVHGQRRGPRVLRPPAARL